MKLHFVTSMDEVLKVALEREFPMQPMAQFSAAEIIARAEAERQKEPKVH
jgi:hypothetical protein